MPLIAFEGIDGSGKFTQLIRTKEWLMEQNIFVVHSSEPNDQSSPMGDHIRKILKGSKPHPGDPVEFQRMYVIDRAQDIFCFIRPALQEGEVYLIERYAFSTMAYGMLSGPMETFFELHTSILGNSMIWPDMTIILDIPGEEGAKRRGKLPGNPQFFEKAELLEKVRQNYLEIAHHSIFRNSIVIINGSQPEEEVFQNVKSVMKSFLKGRNYAVN